MVTQQASRWYYVDAERQSRGPLPPGELKVLADQGVIRCETPVWTEGYGSWVRASEVAGLVAPPAATPPAVPPALPAAPAGITLPDQRLKPRIGSFIFRRMVAGVILFAILSVGVCGVLALAGKAPAMGLLVLVLGVAFTVYAALVAYRKERYDLLEGTVVCHRGGLMSDQKTELEIRNITHVKVRLPWMRYKLFGVGNVLIESAGNAQPVVLRDVRGPEDVYAGMRERMRSNGYGLTQQQLLHEEGPAIIGVILDCLRMAVVGLVVILFILPTLIPIAGANDYPVATAVLSFLSIAAILGVVAAIVVRFLDLRRRTYRVYNDVVVYEEGFLTRNNAFIPAENIADAATTRSLRDKFLSLYDVVISCQGSTSAIRFRRLRHGVQLSRCIDQLVLETGRKPAPGTGSARKATTAAASIPRRAEPDLVAPGEAWVADLKMSPARVFVPFLLLLPLLPLWIIAMIQAAIRLMSTNYAVRPGSIRHSYRFLTTHDREFAYDKITGLVIKESLWDRLCGTVTLRFWSIGSGQSLVLAHVLRKDVDIDSIKRQIGIPAASAHPCEVPSAFGVFAWLRSRCLRLVFALVAAIGFAVAAMQFGENLLYLPAAAVAVTCLAGFGYARAFYSRQRLRFHDHHVEAEQGVITRRRYLARYPNVKKTLVTRYPGGREGSLQIFVAGEQLVSAGRSGTVRVPCAFTLGFLPDAMEQGQLLDDILCGRVDPASGSTPADPLDPLYQASRSVGNTLFKLILASVLIVPLVVLLPLTIPTVVLVVKRWRYRLEASRVATSWGLLFRKQASIILDRVDSLQQQQGPLNKLFRNGNVSIMTAGSSQPDLVMPNAPDYETLYQEIRARSQGGEGH